MSQHDEHEDAPPASGPKKDAPVERPPVTVRHPGLRRVLARRAPPEAAPTKR
jgi:hypothetical protein